MARDHVRMKLSVSADDDFCDLTLEEQHLYWVLMTSLSLSYCGVADWRPKRIARRARGWTPEAVDRAARGLIKAGYILVDEDTEEVLIRSFVRDDELMKQPKMAVALATAYASVASRVLRGVIVHELVRLRQDFPDLKGWGSEQAVALLSKASVDPSTYPLGDGSYEGSGEGSPDPTGEGSGEASVEGSPKGSVKGSAKGKRNPSGKGSGEGSPTPYSLLLTPTPTDELRSSGAAAPRATSAGPIVGAWVESYTEHVGRPPNGPQRGQVGKEAKTLLDDGAPPDLVLQAAVAVGAKGLSTLEREYAPLAARQRNGRHQTDPTTGMTVEVDHVAPLRRDPTSGMAVER